MIRSSKRSKAIWDGKEAAQRTLHSAPPLCFISQ